MSILESRLSATIIFGLACGFLLLDAHAKKRWLAGDHHVHSQYSVGWDDSTIPPTPIPGGDAINPIPRNVELGQKYGLSWMVTTYHGGPNHSKLNRDQAYPELVASRATYPGILQFYGMELNTPGADHSSLIIPRTDDERNVLLEIEGGFDKYEAFPQDPSRDTEEHMLAALSLMRDLPSPPLLIANHPSRSARMYGEYGLHSPKEFRAWNNLAPDVAIGMAGAPGHQASTLVGLQGFSVKRFFGKTPRGAYSGYPTMGGFDQMTAVVGGFWDSMLGEGRNWWITANSDFHRYYKEDGIDFYPGEYSKTYVYAEKTYESVLAALRSGAIFVTTGDLVSEVSLKVSSGDQIGTMGSELVLKPDASIHIEISIRDPNELNVNDDNPSVKRVDLITGIVGGKLLDLTTNENTSTVVAYRFSDNEWQREGEVLTMSHRLLVENSMYLRIRGTNTDELEPLRDTLDENPWEDLWFYSNPVFIRVD